MFVISYAYTENEANPFCWSSLCHCFQGLFETKKQSQFFARLRAVCTGPQVYMAPEAMERFEFTAAADVYSFGEPYTTNHVYQPVSFPYH